jgi:DAK2 domain fusion protein YloV
MSSVITTKKLKEMFINGSKFVSKECERINELNVFPVPDGDTGTNMTITIEGACNSIRLVEHADLQALGKQFARGLLMNARGNSGVIFSQIMKGFVVDFESNQTELDIVSLKKSFSNATKIAYESMVTPIEGTILTVIRETAEAIKNCDSSMSVINFFAKVCQAARESLIKTPDYLPELRESGVVDSGGYGLCCFLDGMCASLNNNQQTSTNANIANQQYNTNKPSLMHSLIKDFKEEEEEEEVFGYCTEFIMILLSKVTIHQKDKEIFDLNNFKKIMLRLGNSLAVVCDDNIVKVHIHTIKPYDVLREASRFGEFSKIKIDNMTLQFLERNPGTVLENMESKKRKLNAVLNKETRIIATVSSTVMSNIYKNDLKITNTINTAATGNPSISEFLRLIRETKSQNIIIVVDDSNIVLAAKEAIKLTPKTVEVDLLKADDQAASYVACSEYDTGLDRKNNFNNIKQALSNLSSGKISYSVKNTELNGIKIKKGEYIGVMGKRILISDKTIQNVCKKIIDSLVNNTKRPQTAYIIQGKDALLEDVKAIRKYINEKHLLKVKTIFGNQTIYPFYIAIK